MSCCSDHAVTFHYISPNMMYVMEYLIYHLQPYGVQQPFLAESVAVLKRLSPEQITEIARKRAVAFRGTDDVIFDANGQQISVHTPPPADLLEKMKVMVADQMKQTPKRKR